MYSDPRSRQFEELLRDGISAAKSGQQKLAQSLLYRATLLNGADARPYIWLSATTDDPAEQIDYLEKAVAIEPSNVAARRGLALLKGKIDPARLANAGDKQQVESAEPLDVKGEAFQCPKCGGRMSFSVEKSALTCEYCGYIKEAPQVKSGPVEGQVLDFALPTDLGHSWADSQMRLACERCGAVNLLAPGQKATQCAYCGSNQLVEPAESGEFVDPQVIALIKVDEQQANKRARDWLSRGFWSPDNLLGSVHGLRLRPAYYSCWMFDGTVEVHWSCEVQETSYGSSQRWEPRSGAEFEYFNQVVVPGVRSLKPAELESIEPFNLVDVEAFKGEHLAGWPALIYDIPLSDASLDARELVLRKFRPQIYSMIEPAREKRNIRIGGGAWSDMTFKHVLLPIWIGTYHFQNKEFHILVNGQTGKVGGDKPKDTVKITFGALTVVMFMILLVVIYWLFFVVGGR